MARQMRSGLLDFPRKKLPDSVWEYLPEEPLPRLRRELRDKILNEARYRTRLMGAKLIGANLYGGASGYQYHEGGDIDVSLYIDWDSFKGNEETIQDAFKNVEIPWGGYKLHLFIKPEAQVEQVEVADATYDVFNDKWRLPPLILPGDFDPEIYFKPLIELAEKKAQEIDVLMGRVRREWNKLKKAHEALKEGARDEEVVRHRLELQKEIVSDLVDLLVKEFTDIWVARRKMHDELRSRFVLDRNVGRFERFQPPEVTWKYLDEAGQAEFLKLLAKAHESGAIAKLLNAIS